MKAIMHVLHVDEAHHSDNHHAQTLPQKRTLQRRATVSAGLDLHPSLQTDNLPRPGIPRSDGARRASAAGFMQAGPRFQPTLAAAPPLLQHQLVEEQLDAEQQVPLVVKQKPASGAPPQLKRRMSGPPLIVPVQDAPKGDEAAKKQKREDESIRRRLEEVEAARQGVPGEIALTEVQRKSPPAPIEVPPLTPMVAPAAAPAAAPAVPPTALPVETDRILEMVANNDVIKPKHVSK
jgi:hypothetical protein